MITRRIIQTITLMLFLILLFTAIFASSVRGGIDIFLRMDPLLALGSIISSRTFPLALIPAFIVILVALFAGRIFCGYVCPMGTTVDLGDRFFGKKRKKAGPKPALFRIKYLILLFILGSSLLTVSFVFTSSPISLITRFYGLLVYPVVSLFGHIGLAVIQPVADKLDIQSIMFADLPSPRFSTLFFILGFFALVFSAALISPRFWCRYLCPSGALLSIMSLKPLLKRSVSDSCIKCGKCTKNCPMNAIPLNNPLETRHGECIVCLKCEEVCPVNAISFRPARASETKNRVKDFLPSRRQFMAAGFSGVGVAAVNLSGINSLYGKIGVGSVLPHGLVRPPGAMDEKQFLALCVRCGECMAACPNNALQPIWFEGGVTGLFSPSLVPKRGACSSDCNKCGAVCPTGAIRELVLEERRWAKTGTAMILKERCLAWEQQKRCMVCDEVCPYKAVKFRTVPDNPVPVPEVIEDRCSGCGFCEHHCPVLNQSAIVVTPMGALRLNEGSFIEQGRQKGLDISLAHEDESAGFSGDTFSYPGDTGQGDAPGFISNDSESPDSGYMEGYGEGPSGGFEQDYFEGNAPGFTE